MGVLLPWVASTAPAGAADNAPIPAGLTTVNLLNINDFHGNIGAGEIGPKLACLVENQKRTLGETSVAFDGLKVAVIGAVTQETPTLVDGSKIGEITFGDPVDAINRVAGQLKAANTADIIVASYHSGAAGSGTLATEKANSPTFARIVEGTANTVDVIFTAHTHQRYIYDAPVPNGTGTRPVIQSGAGNSSPQPGLVKHGYDTATKKITHYNANNLPMGAQNPAATDPCVSDPQYLAAEAVIDQATATATDLGKPVVSQITADITRAWADASLPVRDGVSTVSFT